MTPPQQITRRGFLKVGGSALAALICAPIPELAAGPWEIVPTLVAAATQASNPRNSQPWLFRAAAGRIDLFADSTRWEGSVDPYGRELFLGLGCALENLLLAAPAHGYTGRLALLPEPADSSHAARVDLEPAALSRPDLFPAIPLRRTNRSPYQSKPVSRSLLEALEGLNQEACLKVVWFTSEADRGEAAGVVEQAERAVRADPEQSRDRDRWPDGSPELAAAGLQARTAPAFGILAVRDAGDNRQRLLAGMLWQRMHLWATAEKLAMQPMNQAIQRAERESSLGIEAKFSSALKVLLGGSDWQPVMQFRLGYPAVEAPPSLRRPVESVMI
jgi:nitroreductase